MNRLFGRPRIGLALGGGGARAGAHLGVLRVLSELNCKPDVIVGSSMGAVIAVMYGAGFSLPRMEEILCQSDLSKIVYPDRSRRSLLGTDRLADLLREHLGDADLREFSPKIAMMATDIRAGQRVLLEEGSAVKALLATIAIPGLFPPVEWGDRLLVDGGVLDNVPTQATYQLGADRLIAVDVSGGEWTTDFTLDNVRSFSTQLHRALYWLLNLSKRQETFEVWIKSSMLTYAALTQYHLEAYPPDVLIRPDMPTIGLLSLEMIPSTIVAGENAARAVKPILERLVRSWYHQRKPPARSQAVVSLRAT